MTGKQDPPFAPLEDPDNRITNSSDEYDQLVIEDLNYGSYLKIPELLKLQELRSRPLHHDEMFFIIIHQTTELWFKEILHEADLLAECFAKSWLPMALKVLKRINGVMEVLCRQIELLGTLTPREFAGFREALGTGSGFQSVQFRSAEFAFGQRNPWFFQFFEQRAAEIAELRRRYESPSIYDCFLSALAKDGKPVPRSVLERDFQKSHVLDQELVELFHELYSKPESEYLWILICESLLDLDTLWSKWRAVHILMVSRTIGTQMGTGGSTGIKFLQSRQPLRFFPELWELRNASWE